MQKIYTVSVSEKISLKFRFSSIDGGVRVGIARTIVLDNPLRTTPPSKSKENCQEQKEKR